MSVVAVLVLRALGEWKEIERRAEERRRIVTDLGRRAVRPCVAARRRGGRARLRGPQATGVTSISTKSTDTDIVTEFDRASERLIVDGLRAARPDDALVGEEGTDSAGTSGVRWLIDPIDGTTNFLYDLPGYAVSIAAPTDDGTLAGAVYVPAHSELFTAVAGQGAALERRADPLRHDDRRCSTALVATGFSYHVERRRDRRQRIAELIPRVRDIRRFGAAAPTCATSPPAGSTSTSSSASGPWDLAAGELIAREAGLPHGAVRRRTRRPERGARVPTRRCSIRWSSCWRTPEPGRNPGIM